MPDFSKTHIITLHILQDGVRETEFSARGPHAWEDLAHQLGFPGPHQIAGPGFVRFATEMDRAGWWACRTSGIPYTAEEIDATYAEMLEAIRLHAAGFEVPV